MASKKLTRDIMEWFFSRKTKMFKDMNRARKICEMHLQGMTFKEIGEALNIDGSYASSTVKRIVRYHFHYQLMLEKERESKPTEKMYTAFRSEIDEMLTPALLKIVTTIPIMVDEKQVGIFCYVPQDEFIYIDALYIMPEYRRNHLAAKAVLEWYEMYKSKEIRLHIIDNNATAQAFWNSIFKLEAIEITAVDTLYIVKGLRCVK